MRTRLALKFGLSMALALPLLPACADDGGGEDEAATNSDGDTTDSAGTDTSDSADTGGTDTTGDGDTDTGGTDTTDTGGTDTTDTGSTDTTDTGSTDTTDTGGTDTGGSVCDAEYSDCAGLEAAFAEETLAVRKCEDDADCGQVLQGTSCGCTRNWVANNAADTTCFYSLIELAGSLQCDLGLASTCDCPEADGFVCDAGICQWNYL